MANNPIFRGKYEIGITHPLDYYTDEQLQKVLETLGLEEFSGEIKHKLIEAAEIFVSDVHHLNNYPRPSERKKEHQVVHKFATKLQVHIRNLTDASRLDYERNFSAGGIDLLENVEKSLCSLVDSGSAMRKLFDSDEKGGRPKNPALRVFILLLDEIYQKVTNTPPRISYDAYSGEYSGRFLDFAEACLAPIAPELCTRTSLGKSIQRIRKGHRLTRTPVGYNIEVMDKTP